MFVLIYRISVEPAKTDSFITASWQMAQLLKEKAGSFGSRLYRDTEGQLISISMWPDRASWESREIDDPAVDRVRSLLGECGAVFVPLFILDQTIFNNIEEVDRLLPPAAAVSSHQ